MPARPSPRAHGDLRLRVARGPRAADGRWYWRCLRYTEGREEPVWVGWATIAEADERTAGAIRGVTEPSALQARTVRDLLSLWHGSIEARGDLAPATVAGYGAAAVRVRDVIGPSLVDAVDRLTVERYRDTRLRLGSTPRTVQKDLTILGLAWRWGREVGIVTAAELPRVRVHLDELTHTRVKLTDAAEAIAALTGASRLHLLLVVASGCRVSEIGHLRRRDVEGRWITVTGKRRTRRIPLPLDAAAELAAWMEAHPGAEDGTVLGYRGASAREMLFRRMKEAGITWTPRDARRARTNAIYASGVDPGVAGALLGHSPEVALRHYRRAAEEELLEAVDREPVAPKVAGVRPVIGRRRAPRVRR